MQQIKIVLPAYNEALSLPLLMEKIAQMKGKFSLFCSVLVVNDGSTDDTLNVAKIFGGGGNLKLLIYNRIEVLRGRYVPACMRR